MTVKYVMVGAGAIGGTIAHSLVRAGHEVIVVDRSPEHVNAIRRRGLRVRRADGHDESVDVDAYLPEEYPGRRFPVQYGVIATKAQDTAIAARWLSSRLAESGRVISLQNGHNERVISKFVDPHRVISVFVNIFADYLLPGVISDGGAGALAVGLPGGLAPDADCLEVAKDFRSYGPVTSTANVEGFRFAKRGFSAILQVTSLVDEAMCDVVREFPNACAEAAMESTEVAVRAGIALEGFDGYDPYAFSKCATPGVREGGLSRLEEYLAGQTKNRSGIFRDIAVRRRPIERECTDDGYRGLALEQDVAPAYSDILNIMLGELSRGERQFGTANILELRQRVLEYVPV